jgi:hypothetical protein
MWKVPTTESDSLLPIPCPVAPCPTLITWSIATPFWSRLGLGVFRFTMARTQHVSVCVPASMSSANTWGTTGRNGQRHHEPRPQGAISLHEADALGQDVSTSHDRPCKIDRGLDSGEAWQWGATCNATHTLPCGQKRVCLGVDKRLTRRWNLQGGIPVPNGIHWKKLPPWDSWTDIRFHHGRPAWARLPRPLADP